MNSLRIFYVQLLSLLIINLSAIASTHVFVNNITPYGWKWNCEVQDNSLTLNKNLKIHYDGMIKPWAQRVDLCEFARDKGISDHFIYEHLRSLTFSDCTITFVQHIWKKLKLVVPTFGMEVGIDYKIRKKKSSLMLTQGQWEGFKKPIDIVFGDKKKNNVEFNVQYRTVPGGSFHNVEYFIRGMPNKPGNRYSTFSSKKSSNIINGLVWNVYLMTVKGMGGDLAELAKYFIPKMKEIEKPGVYERVKNMPEAIGSDYDFIIFNEVWDNDARRSLLVGLSSQGYKYSSCILGSGYLKNRKLGMAIDQPFIVDFSDKKFTKDLEYMQGGNGSDTIFHGLKHAANGGVIIVSAWPIERTAEMIYSKSSKEDGLAKKGVVYAQINKKGMLYHIFGTHLDTDPSVQEAQAAECAQFIASLKIPENEPVLIGGDFNRAMDSSLRNAFQADEAKLIGDLIYSQDGFHDYLSFNQQRLDYLMYSRLHAQPEEAINEIRIMTSKKPWSDWDSPLAKEYPLINIYDLSDHYSAYGYFKFPKKEKPQKPQHGNQKPSKN